MVVEIGSEFWLEERESTVKLELPKWISKFGDSVLTSSGRGAINLLLQQVNPRHKTVLLPAYICESVISPFINQGYKCYFYEINKDLSPNIDSILLFNNIGVFLHMGYFGFHTNENLLEVLRYLKKLSTIVVEDITHTLFSKLVRFEENDFYVASIRKWIGLPSGGFLASSRVHIDKVLNKSESFSEIRREALVNKGKYIRYGDENLKEVYLNQFSKAEALLNQDIGAYSIDSLSRELINSLEFDELIKKRKENFMQLLTGLHGQDFIEPLFLDMDEGVCPLFFPVVIKNDRDEVRRRLINKKIYCPVHWPIPNQILGQRIKRKLGIYNNTLSIPCDQRYGSKDMQRIISVLKTI